MKWSSSLVGWARSRLSSKKGSSGDGGKEIDPQEMVANRATAAAVLGHTKTSDELNEIANKLTGQNEQLEKVFQEIHGLGSISSKVKEGAERSIQDIQLANEQMHVVSELVGNTKQIVTDIKRVANQTQLLAINAGIEAVHAGAAGRSFTTIAGEIKKLSEEVAASNEKTEDLIRNLAATSVKTAEYLQHATESIQAFLKDTKQTGESSHTIADLHTRIERATQELSGVRASADASKVDLKEMSVIGETIENLITQVRRYTEDRPDPLDRFEAIAATTGFLDAKRFSHQEREVIMDDDDVLVSATDFRGIITFANKSFYKIAGYEYGELEGKPHNIIRHPDMPKAAFADLWTYLKQEKVWQGYVKNRTKQGAIYWVKAMAFPRYKNGTWDGYMSVRVKAEREQIPRAVECYRRIP